MIKGTFNGRRLRDGRLSISITPEGNVTRDEYISMQDMPVIIMPEHEAVLISQYASRQGVKPVSAEEAEVARRNIKTIRDLLYDLDVLLTILEGRGCIETESEEEV